MADPGTKDTSIYIDIRPTTREGDDCLLYIKSDICYPYQVISMLTKDESELDLTIDELEYDSHPFYANDEVINRDTKEVQQYSQSKKETKQQEEIHDISRDWKKRIELGGNDKNYKHCSSRNQQLNHEP